MSETDSNWYLVFEQQDEPRTPGATFVSGVAAGSGPTRRAKYRTFKNVMLVEARDWDHALEQAVILTGRLAQFAAVRCEIFIPERIQVLKRRRGEDGTEGTG